MKILDIRLGEIQTLFLFSILLSIPAILFNDFLLLLVPAIILLILTLIFGERFLTIIIIVSLFTIVGEVSQIARQFVYLVDFSLLGYFFFRKYGVNFKSYPSIPKSVKLFLILYYCSMIISTVMSDYPFAGIGLMTRQMALFIIAYVFYSLINSIEDIKLYFNSIFVVGFVLVTFSLIAFFQGDVSLLEIFSPNRPRISAIITNIEASTNFFVVSFPILLVFLLVKNKFLRKKFEYFYLFYFSVGLVLTMSRSAIIGITFSTLMLLFILKRKRFYQLLSFMTLLVLSFIFIQPLNELLTSFLRIESGMSARDQIWKMSIEMISDHTLFGIGPGAYKYEMFNYFPFMLDNWWGKLFIYFYEATGGVNLSHNYFLTLFTEMGILGLLTSIALPTVYIRIGIKTMLWYKNHSHEKYYLIIGLFAAGCSIILRNFFNGIGLLYVGGIQTDLPFWLVFGSLIYFYRVSINSDRLQIQKDSIEAR